MLVSVQDHLNTAVGPALLFVPGTAFCTRRCGLRRSQDSFFLFPFSIFFVDEPIETTMNVNQGITRKNGIHSAAGLLIYLVVQRQQQFLTV